MLEKTLSLRECLLCQKARGFRTVPICRSCLKRLPPAKRVTDNLFIAFNKEVELPRELEPILAASRYYSLGGKTDCVLQKDDQGFSEKIAWHLRVPLREILTPYTLVVDKYYQKQQLLSSIQYLFLFSS